MFGVSAVAVLALSAGCASSAQPAGSGGANLTPPAGAASASPGSSGSGGVVRSGPAATAATGAPPPAGKHAVASIDGANVACPDGAPYAAPQNDRTSAAPLAADAEVTVVVRCENVVRSYPGLGTWNVQLAEVADSGLGPFLTALRTPSAKRPPDIVCPMYMRLAPWFALVDASGAIVRPPWPTDQCGQVSAVAIDALNRLDFRVVDAVRVSQAS